jgi:hypothetical protein
MYSIKKKSERRFFCFEPPIRISGYCLALDSNSGGREQSELLELRRIKKGVIGLALGHVSLPSPPPLKKINKIRQAVWNCHGAKK